MPDAPDGSIIITPKEFYDGVKADVAAIRESQAQIAAALQPLPDRVAKLESKVDDLDRRQNATDKKLAYFAGVAAAVGALAGSLLPRLFS